jgi:hypothetical protein
MGCPLYYEGTLEDYRRRVKAYRQGDTRGNLRIPTPLEEICDCTTEAYPDGSVFQAQRAWGKTEADSGSSVRHNARIACGRLLRSSAKSARTMILRILLRRSSSGWNVSSAMRSKGSGFRNPAKSQVG